MCFLAPSSPPKQGEEGDRAIGEGTGAAVSVTARLRVETKTDFPLRGATTAEADRESPAVSRLRRSAAVAAALAEDAPDDGGGGVEDIFLKTLIVCLK